MNIFSCPTKGKAYGRADPHGFIQLDLCAFAGSGMVAAYGVTENPRYWEAAKHWADLLAERCKPRSGASPWPRYANPEDVPAKDGTGADWGPKNIQTGGVALMLRFINDVIEAGCRGKDDSLVKAREAGEIYLRDVLLPEWSRNPTFGHNSPGMPPWPTTLGREKLRGGKPSFGPTTSMRRASWKT